MMCPNGHAALQITERSGVEIDYCPECRGVWLDRGELDKIIERADAASGPRRDEERRGEERRDDRRDVRGDSEYRSSSPHGHPKKKSSFLGDMFDF